MSIPIVFLCLVLPSDIYLDTGRKYYKTIIEPIDYKKIKCINTVEDSSRKLVRVIFII